MVISFMSLGTDEDDPHQDAATCSIAATNISVEGAPPVSGKYRYICVG